MGDIVLGRPDLRRAGFRRDRRRRVLAMPFASRRVAARGGSPRLRRAPARSWSARRWLVGRHRLLGTARPHVRRRRRLVGASFISVLQELVHLEEVWEELGAGRAGTPFVLHLQLPFLPPPSQRPHEFPNHSGDLGIKEKREQDRELCLHRLQCFVDLEKARMVQDNGKRQIQQRTHNLVGLPKRPEPLVDLESFELGRDRLLQRLTLSAELRLMCCSACASRASWCCSACSS